MIKPRYDKQGHLLATLSDQPVSPTRLEGCTCRWWERCILDFDPKCPFRDRHQIPVEHLTLEEVVTVAARELAA